MVLLNGTPISGVLEMEITSNNHCSADRYRVVISLTACGYVIWTSATLSVEIRGGLNGAWVSLIIGAVDRLEIDTGRQELSVEGRDLTAMFIGARTEESFTNQTASDIATTLARRQGLTAQITPTTGLIGRKFDNDHARTTLAQYGAITTQWDLLSYLAEYEGFDVWVSGRTLNFAPPDQAGPVLAVTPADCMSVRMTRDMELESGVAVTVKSWDCRGQQVIAQTAGKKAIGSSSYIILRPNMSQNAANAMAQRTAIQMTQQARTIQIDMPGDLTTAPRGLLALSDTGTDFDSLYLITDVERHMSFHSGFTQTIHARIPPWMISLTS